METKVILNCCTVLLHSFSMIVSISLLFLIGYRWHFNRHHRRCPSLPSICLFDDSVSLLLFGNIYLILLAFSVTWLSILLHTIAGDFSILQDLLYLGDSITCRLRVAILFFLTSTSFHSYLLQALWCFIKVMYHSTLHAKQFCFLSLSHISTYILLILITWLVSLIVLIPALIVFNVFSYFPEQYHCLISLTNVRGFVYSLLCIYIIPVHLIIFIYIRLMRFIHHLPNSGHILHAKREVTIVRRILTICTIISFSGSTSLFFLFQFIITGKVHPLADRIHELGIAINTSIVTLSFAILNSFTNLLPTKSDV